jgi:hypothetical protein
MMLLYLIPKISHILSEREKAKHHHCLGKVLEIPHMRDQKGSYKGIFEFYFENLKKLQNEGWSKNSRRSALI